MSEDLCMIRWKGHEYGPFRRQEILAALSTRKISMLHEVRTGVDWIPMRQYLATLENADAEDEERTREILEHTEAERSMARAQLSFLEHEIERLKVERLIGQDASRAAPVSRATRKDTGAPAAEFRYANFWRRASAKLIDLVVINSIVGCVGLIIGLLLLVLPAIFGLMWSPGSGGMSQQAALVAYGFLAATVSWLYSARLESSPRQATIGKAALGLKVSLANGEPLTFLRASGRHFASYLSALPAGAGYLSALSNAKRQTFHDIVANTVVIETP